MQIFVKTLTGVFSFSLTRFFLSLLFSYCLECPWGRIEDVLCADAPDRVRKELHTVELYFFSSFFVIVAFYCRQNHYS